MKFPAEDEPDGDALAPHHFTYGMLLLLLACAVVWNDKSNMEPVITALGVVIGLFAFNNIWPYYKKIGAALVVVGNSMALVGPFIEPAFYRAPIEIQVVAILLALLSADDTVSHAFGVWTPVDHIWKEWFVPEVLGRL